MRKVIESDNPTYPGWGIEDSNGYIEYEPGTFEKFIEAVAIANAHDAGAESYEDAVFWVKENMGIEIHEETTP